MSDDLGFDPSLKKKKKSKKVEDGSSESTPVPELDDMLSGLKKKKKSKKIDGDEETNSPVPDDLTASLGDLTLKKKKKKSLKNVDATDFEQQLEEAGVEDVSGSNNNATIDGESSNGDEEGIIPYDDLLSRFFDILKKNNPELAGDRSGPKFRIPPPVCQREGSKKTLFANVQEIAQVLQRNPEHLIQFLFAELGTSGSIDGEKRLVLKGKFQPKQMESVLRRYIIEYVTCKTCKSMNTELKRESGNRLHFLSCKVCGSTRSVSSIKTGFQAQVGRRKRV
ncbi:translation initiation factor eIF-2 beta subunit [Scheffersomyces spartinae]|uniref:Translation initiation factor eIF-2 beta subunit n=1 Tax=Scheffersomyces spartinae TaxID=45513 RepID=A0A9P7V5Y8_9ASCO|nr:translation initiation factor eIF-2 beta subunit [Scheffersomyces spartinae]KAG7191790.1 translation initiation factor eIF-2 beta subunit [Scheffersomyces spartinae]